MVKYINLISPASTHADIKLLQEFKRRYGYEVNIEEQVEFGLARKTTEELQKIYEAMGEQILNKLT